MSGSCRGEELANQDAEPDLHDLHLIHQRSGLSAQSIRPDLRLRIDATRCPIHPARGADQPRDLLSMPTFVGQQHRLTIRPLTAFRVACGVRNPTALGLVQSQPDRGQRRLYSPSSYRAGVRLSGRIHPNRSTRKHLVGAGGSVEHVQCIRLRYICPRMVRLPRPSRRKVLMP